MISGIKGNVFYWHKLWKVKITPTVQVVTSRHMETQIRPALFYGTRAMIGCYAGKISL